MLCFYFRWHCLQCGGYFYNSNFSSGADFDRCVITGTYSILLQEKSKFHYEFNDFPSHNCGEHYTEPAILDESTCHFL